jgi:hypothetical protein
LSELATIVTELRQQHPADEPDAVIEDDVVELSRLLEQLQVERLRRLRELERRRLFERDGHGSAAGWLVARTGCSWGQARRDIRLARGLDAMPLVSDAVAEGEVSLCSARVLAELRPIDPETFTRNESILLDAARTGSVAQLHRVGRFWRDQVERANGSDRDEVLANRRALHASVTLDGIVRIDGDLDPLTGETVLTALRSVTDAEARDGADDPRSPAQRRADALGEICRAWLDRSDRPEVAGERPHVTVTVPLGRLTNRLVPDLDHTGPIGDDLARLLACDASVTRVVLSPRSEPLDVGRRTPVVPPAIRRALVVRDAGCRFPACDRPHHWCDAHHVVHWADGGATALDNLVLLCRRHHRAVHENFHLDMQGGRPVFHDAVGAVMPDERAPP